MVVLLVAVWAAFAFLIMPGVGRLITPGAGAGARPIDLTFVLPPAEIAAMVAAYGEAGRVHYALFEATMDVLYPLVYGLMLIALIGWCARRARLGGKALGEKASRALVLLPVAVVAADYLENAGIITLLVRYPDAPFGVAAAVSVLTGVKWSLVGLCLALAAGLAVAGWRRS
jgi:hypothetical protein